MVIIVGTSILSLRSLIYMFRNRALILIRRSIRKTSYLLHLLHTSIAASFLAKSHNFSFLITSDYPQRAITRANKYATTGEKSRFCLALTSCYETLSASTRRRAQSSSRRSRGPGKYRPTVKTIRETVTTIDTSRDVITATSAYTNNNRSASS